MTEGVKTGNVLLDAWLDALTPFLPEPVASGGAATTATTTTAATNVAATQFWERMFLGDRVKFSVGEFTSAFGTTARLSELWSDLAQRSVGVVAALGSNANAGDPLGKALEQSFGVVGDVGGAALAGPALLAEATNALSVLCAAREAYRGFMLATWQRAFEEVTREALSRAGEGKPVASPAQWLSLSNEVADRVFVQAFNSQPYLDVQHQLSNALAEQRRSEMKFVESFARFGHFPTRRALDDVIKELSELRRRVRRLERASRGAPSESRRKAKAVDDA